MGGLPAASVDLVFADPPFGIGYEYDHYVDGLRGADYRAWTYTWVFEVARLLNDRGSVFVAIGDEHVCDVKAVLDGCGLTRRNWIVWHYSFGPHQNRKFGRDHCHILYYVKDPKRFTFNSDAVRIESARQRSGDKRANPKGRVPGDVWEFARLPGNANERTGHPCQIPEALLERIVLAASNPGDTVFDPFAGSGTTLAVAKRLGRIPSGCELSKAYCAAITKRLK